MGYPEVNIESGFSLRYLSIMSLWGGTTHVCLFSGMLVSYAEGRVILG